MKPELLAALAGIAVGWFAADGINKTPGVRVLDVVVLGPFMVVASFGSLSPAQRQALAFAGGATMSYNLHNYLGNLKRGEV